MGMYDTVFVDSEIAEECDIKCKKCGARAKDYQTKDFHNAMDEYFIKKVESGDVKMFVLEKPSEEGGEFWHGYTPEEISELQKEIQLAEEEERPWTTFSTRFRLDNGGYFLEEAFFPENREQKNMGELPHKWIRIYDKCRDCKTWNEFEVKFTDGVLQVVKWIDAEMED